MVYKIRNSFHLCIYVSFFCKINIIYLHPLPPSPLYFSKLVCFHMPLITFQRAYTPTARFSSWFTLSDFDVPIIWKRFNYIKCNEQASRSHMHHPRKLSSGAKARASARVPERPSCQIRTCSNKTRLFGGFWRAMTHDYPSDLLLSPVLLM